MEISSSMQFCFFAQTIDLPGDFGGRTWARTKDPLIKSQLLYQLSYASISRTGQRPGEGVAYSGSDHAGNTFCDALRRRSGRVGLARRNALRCENARADRCAIVHRPWCGGRCRSLAGVRVFDRHRLAP